MRRALPTQLALVAVLAIAWILWGSGAPRAVTPLPDPERAGPPSPSPAPVGRGDPAPSVATPPPDATAGPPTPGPVEGATTAPPAAPFLAWFRLAWEGRPAPEGLHWTASGGRFHEMGPLVAAAARPQPGVAEAPPEEGLHGPVRVPTTVGEVTFEVLAPGWAPWSVEDVVPRAGATRVYAVGLRRLPSGRLRLAVTAADGRPLSLAGDGLLARLERADEGPRTSPPARDVEGAVGFDGLEPGRYRVVLAARGHGAAAKDVEVGATEAGPIAVALPPQASVRVRVLGEGGRRVRVRITREDRVVPAFPDPAPPTSESGLDPLSPTFLVGEDGLLLGGLAPGPHLVEVLDPERATFGARFDAVGGETVEVEVRPRSR